MSAIQNDTIRVSVVIPAYKVADTLGKAIESALAQTERNIEVVVVDDHSPSPDRTYEVAQEYAARDPRVRAMRTPKNSARSGAVNFGVNQARGKWIAVLDGDDWYAPKRLKRLVDAAEAAGVEMVTDNQMFVDFKANACVGTAFPQGIGPRFFELDSFLKATDPTARFDYGMLKQVYRADFIREHKIEYYEPARTGEDFYGLLCFFAAGGRALVLDEPLYYYVQPFGMKSRQWAQEGRKPYNYALLKEINDHFVREFEGRLSPEHLAILKRRGRGIEAMQYYHQMQDCLREGKLYEAVRKIVAGRFYFWKLLAKRLMQRTGLLRDPAVTPLPAA
jgi:glycosyltransferase involved in cell wall biosynthesis